MTTSQEPERVDFKTRPPAEDRESALRELFPEAFSDGEFHAEAIKAALGKPPGEGSERYGLSWAGRGDAQRAIQRPSVATLHPDLDRSLDFDNSQNVIVEGDNLEVLRLLQRGYNDQVKLIYIDPPYNTGHDFVYEDDFTDDLGKYLSRTTQVDPDGNRLSSNGDTTGRYHSSWMSMMFPRLVLARNLLTTDGSIFVSIDDHELHNLYLLMSEVFGEENFIAQFIWEKRTTRENRRAFSVSHDYILCFARNKELFEAQRGLLPLSDAAADRYSNPDDDPRGDWQSVSLNAQAGHATEAQFYEITTPGGRVLNPPPGRCWSVTETKLAELMGDNRVWFGQDGINVPRLKHFLTESTQGLTPHTLWKATEVGTNDSAKKHLLDLLGEDAAFDTPKPVELLTRIVQIGAPASNDLVLDFFAGSGTTAEAVMTANSQDDGCRRFLLVQLPETFGGRSGRGSAASSPKMRTIADLCAERVRRVLARDYRESDGFGFRYFTLAESNFELWDPGEVPTTADELAATLLNSENNLRSESAADESIAFEIALKEGVGLDAGIERHVINGASVIVAGGQLAVFLGREVAQEHIDAMIDLGVPRVVMLEVAFNGNDEMKSNAFFALSDANIVMKTA